MICFACSISDGLSTVMASTSNPFALFFFKKASIAGISSLQGSHQLAQKFTSKTFPRLLLSEKGLPSMRVPSILGADCPSSMLAKTGLHVSKIITKQ